MIPQIREHRRLRFFERMLITNSRSAFSFFVFVLLFFSRTFASATQQPATPPAKSSAAGPNDATPLQKAVHQKKVITEEDLAKPVRVTTPSDLDAEENNPVCDLSCEAQLRAQSGFGPDHEGEFRNQLTLARHDIGADRAWNYALQSTLNAAGQYCDLQRQKEKILGKGAASEWLRNDVNSRFAEREHKIVLEYKNFADLLKQHIQVVQRFAPFQATVMQYQVSEATQRICPDYTLP